MSNDRYTAWIADQIAEHEPSGDHNAMMRLAQATAALSTGAGMVFGMMMPPELPRREELSAKALAILELWIPRLDEGATEQLFELATRASLPIDLTAQREAHAAARRAKLDERLAKSQALDARFTDLERAIVEDPDDPAAWAVLADFQQGQGDPRGELIALQLAGETDAAKEADAQEYLTKHSDTLLGPLAEYATRDDGRYGFFWHRGFINGAYISRARETADASAILELILRHPSGRFLEALNVGFDGTPGDSSLEKIIRTIAEHTIPTLRFLHLGDFKYPDECQISAFDVGDVGELWRALPRLRMLTVQGNFTLGEVAHDTLEFLHLKSGALPSAVARQVSAAHLPMITELEVWYGSEEYGGDASFLDVAPLLERHDMPALTHLRLRNCEFTDEICDGIAHSRLLRQLKCLDLSLGTMSDVGVDTMVQHVKAFKHLETIDIHRNWISEAGMAKLHRLGPEILGSLSDQRTGDERYVHVGE